jgi:hypothetical protein
LDEGDDDKYKALIDDMRGIHAKGRELEYLPNYLNVIMNSNNYSCLKLKQNQRRYSLFEVSDKNLRTNSNFKSDEAIRQLFTDKDLVARFAYYLWHLKYDEQELAFPFTASRNFKRVLDSSLSEWENYFLTKMCRKFAGKILYTNHVSKMLSDELDNVRSRPSHSKFQALQTRYVGFFKATRYKDGMNEIFVPAEFDQIVDKNEQKFSQIIKFEELADMPFEKYFISEEE